MHSILKRKIILIENNYLHTLYIQYKDKVTKMQPTLFTDDTILVPGAGIMKTLIMH